MLARIPSTSNQIDAMTRGQTEMEQTSTPPRTQASMRQSCDRCHSQKLRCTRPCGGERGSCKRCLRQGAQCVYSASLPKDRPSMYRSSEPRASSTRLPRSPRPKALRAVTIALTTSESPRTPLLANTTASDAATILPPDRPSPPTNNPTQLDPSTLGQGGKDDGLGKLDTPWLSTMVDWGDMQQADRNGLDSADLRLYVGEDRGSRQEWRGGLWKPPPMFIGCPG